MQPTLPTDRSHDLPRFWDGKAVVWRGWEAPLVAWICPPPKPSCCEACGSLARPVTNWGRVARFGGITHDMIAAADAARDRLPTAHQHRLKGHPRALYELTAFRCPDCRHDQILDRDGSMWNLDESDYSDEGSWPR